AGESGGSVGGFGAAGDRGTAWAGVARARGWSASRRARGDPPLRPLHPVSLAPRYLRVSRCGRRGRGHSLARWCRSILTPARKSPTGVSHAGCGTVKGGIYGAVDSLWPFSEERKGKGLRSAYL